MKVAPNDIYKGTGIELYINGARKEYLVSVEFSFKGNYEDVKVCGDYGTHHAYTGYDGEGTVEKFKTSTENEAAELAIQMMAGIVDDNSMLVKVSNKSSGKEEIWKLDEVVFTDVKVSGEAQALMKDSLPFKFCGATLMS